MDIQTQGLIKNLERCACGSYDSCNSCEHWEKECMVTCFPLLKAALAAARKLETYEKMLAEGKLVKVKGDGNEDDTCCPYCGQKMKSQEPLTGKFQAIKIDPDIRRDQNKKQRM